MKRTLSALALVAASLFVCTAFADPQTEAVLNALKTKYPATTFNAVRGTPMPGIFEVQMGRNLAYTDETGRNFLFGAMYDMQVQQDLTAARKAELGIADAPAAQKPAPAPVKWESLPLKDAFVRVSGKGERKIAVFSDPDCPWCKKLERELVKLDNVTIYTFIFPIDSLHPDATGHAKQIWCAGDEKSRAKLWTDELTAGKFPATAKDCANPIDRNVALGESLGVRGTPTLVFADGRRIPGFADAARISALLDAGNAAVAAK